MKKILILVFVALLIVLFDNLKIINFSNKKKDAIKEASNLTDKNLVKFEKYLDEKIKEVGAEKTYILLQKAVADKSAGTQHLIAHVFGDVLYRNLGIKGMSVCDDKYLFGCYHGIFIEALNDYGLPILDKLNIECLKNKDTVNACQHGLGHGIINYLGPKKIVDSLKICSKIQKDNFTGCLQGVFMEYDYPSHIYEDKTELTLRKEDKNNIFHPCPSLPNYYQKYCYFAHTYWLIEVFNNDYQHLGNLCNSIVNEENKNYCLLGLGRQIAKKTNFDLDKILEICQKISPSWLCNAGASTIFQSETKRLCGNFTKEQNKQCLIYSGSITKIK